MIDIPEDTYKNVVKTRKGEYEMIKRTLEEEWYVKCCSNCKRAKIKDYGSDYYCIFKCPLYSKERTMIRGFLDKHYCDEFEVEMENEKC